jgi:hypothetical protein
LLPNVDPGSGNPIFAPNGTIANNNIVGEAWLLNSACGDCSPSGEGIPNKTAGKYYPGAIGPDDFPVPTQSLPAGSAGFNSYQLAVAACVPKPINCGLNADINVDTSSYVGNPTRDADTVEAAKVLIHDKGTLGDSDSIDPASIPSLPFQFIAGNANPITSAVGKNVLISESLVTVPVFESPDPPVSPVQVIGFLQLFLNWQAAPLAGGQIPATIVNMAGCGIAATGQPVLGTGASAIPVRLVSE